jgi:hypothetical protein
MWPDSPWVVDATDGAAAVPEDWDSVVTPGAEPGDLAERLLRRFLGLCESPRTRATMLRMVKASVGSAGAGRAFYAMLNRTVLSPVARATGMQGSAMRYELVASQLIGLAMMRYVLEVEPIASASTDDVVAQMAPAVRAILKG